MKLGKRNSDKDHHAPTPPGAARGGKSKGGAKKKLGHFVLIVGDDGAILVYLQGNTVVRRLFAPSPRPDHTASIVELMQANPNVPLSILADVIDQQYVRHNFPPVSSLSVSNLVKRRMERDFQAEDLKGFLRLGREKDGRKEWSYLLIALANTPLIQQWLELIVELPNELKGIFLSPIEAQHYIPALKKMTGGAALPWQLLLTHNKVSGFRQIVLRDGKLVFTRVTQAIDDGVPAVLAGNIEQEIIGTIEYLRRLGFQENESLEMFIIAAQEVKEVLDIARFRVGGHQVLTPLDVADMFGLQQAALSADRFGDVIMASWFGTSKKRVLKFNTAYGEKLTKFYGAARGLKVVGGVLAVGLIGATLLNVKDAIVLGGEASSIEQQRAPQQGQITKLQKTLDSLDADVAFKTAVVTVDDVYLKDAISPLDFASKLAGLMTETFRAESMEWDTKAQSATPDAAAGPAAALEVKVKISIQGSFPDVEALTNNTDAFVENLKSNLKDYDVKVDPYSWAQNSGDSMEISFDKKADESSAPVGDRSINVTFTAKPAIAQQPGMGGSPDMPPGM